MTSDTKREKYIDAARGFGVFLMFLGHSGVYEPVRKYLYGFHMPLFFIISGYLHDHEKWKERGFRQFVSSRFSTYIIPYFTYAFINLLLYLPVKIRRSESLSQLACQIARHAFYIVYSHGGDGDKMPMCSAMWFLTCIFVACIYFYGLLEMKKEKGRIIICLSALCIYYSLYLFEIPQLPWHVDGALIAMVFMYCGHLFRKNGIIENWRPDSWLLPLAFAAGSAAIIINPVVNINKRVLNNLFLLLTGAICLCFVTMKIFHKVSRRLELKPLRFLGTHSIIILSFTGFITTYSRLVLRRIPVFSTLITQWWFMMIIQLIFCFFAGKLWDWQKERHH